MNLTTVATEAGAPLTPVGTPSIARASALVAAIRGKLVDAIRSADQRRAAAEVGRLARAVDLWSAITPSQDRVAFMLELLHELNACVRLLPAAPNNPRLDNGVRLATTTKMARVRAQERD